MSFLLIALSIPALLATTALTGLALVEFDALGQTVDER